MNSGRRSSQARRPWYVSGAESGGFTHAIRVAYRPAGQDQTPVGASRELLPTCPLKWEAISAAAFSRLLGVVYQARDVDDDHGLISEDPRVVSWSNDADIARAELDFSAVIHLDVHAARDQV